MSPIDAAQLRELVESHGAALVLYARQWSSSPDDALQEALIDYSQLAAAPRDPIAWLFRAVRHKALNLARAQQRRERHHREAAQQRETWFDCDPIEGLQSSELETMLRELEPTARQIIVARIWGEMTFEQIAELVERPLSTVHRQYRQTLELLELQLNGKLEKR